MPEQVQSGLPIYDVMDQRLLLATVLIVAGAHTTTFVLPEPAVMFLSVASEPQIGLAATALKVLYGI